MKLIRFILVGLAGLGLSGCAPVQRYHPQPIAPAVSAERFESRTLADEGLKDFMGKNLGHPVNAWPLQKWGLSELIAASYYFNPQMQLARAQAQTAEAAIITAGARPNPTLSVAPGIPSPYLMEIDFAVPVETHGKRGLRIESAKNLSEAARLSLANRAWKVRSGVRLALANYFLAVRQAEVLHTGEGLNEERVKLLSRQLAAGEISRTEVDTARFTLANTRVELRAAEGQIPTAKAAIAAAIGIPVSGLDGVELVWPGYDHPPAAESFSAETIQREAVLNRLDVRQALANYNAAESNLKLEIARQYPDFNIGPGYRYEEQNNFFVVGFSTVLPIFNRNQGPIAEAEARRKEAAANFIATQARVIAESEAALARYRSALNELAEATNDLIRIQNTRQQMADRALRLGESDRLAVNTVALERSAALTAQLGAIGRAQGALGELEDAVERPLDAADIRPLNQDSPELTKSPKEPKP